MKHSPSSKDRKAFNFYRSFWEQMKFLNEKQIGILTKAICSVQFLEKNVNEIEFSDKKINMVWAGIKHSISESVSGYVVKINSLEATPTLPPSVGGSAGGGKGPSVQEKEKEKEKEKVQGEGREYLGPIPVLKFEQQNPTQSLWPGYDRIREAWPKRDGLSDLAHHQVFRIWMNHSNQIDPENGDHLLATYCEAYLRLAKSAATEPHLVKSLKNYLNDHTYADHLEHVKMAERHESRVVTANGKMPVGFNQAFWDGTIADPKKRGDYAKHLRESGYEYITDANDRVTGWRKKA